VSKNAKEEEKEERAQMDAPLSKPPPPSPEKLPNPRQDKLMPFNKYQAMLLPDEMEESSIIDVVDSVVREEIDQTCVKKAMEASLLSNSNYVKNEGTQYMAGLEANSTIHLDAKEYKACQLKGPKLFAGGELEHFKTSATSPNPN
jgi:hypothetical protein